MTTDPEVVPILVTLGHAGDGTLNLRFPPEYEPEIREELDGNGIEHGTLLEFSAGQDLWIEAVKVLSVPGGLVALGNVIKAVVRRNDGKRFVLKRGDDLIEASGYSDKKVKELLEQVAKQQEEQDARWSRMLEERSKEDGN
jgi:hypothetical protein